MILLHVLHRVATYSAVNPFPLLGVLGFAGFIICCLVAILENRNKKLNLILEFAFGASLCSLSFALGIGIILYRVCRIYFDVKVP